jgi:Arc/MetJ-type ribon-helix-helix transcriptional regulator
MRNKMVPYSVYLPVEVYEKIRALARERKASEAVRDAIMIIMEDGNEYRAGYKKALRDAEKVINACKEIEHIAVRNKFLADVLIDQIKELGEV